MATFIHGIAASENIDSSGERLSISGMDISSLERDGVLNWEHKADQPGQVVGKILKARKIFSEEDCEDDYQLQFFKRCGVPYLYVMGELMDDYKESAKEVAGMFRYDHDRQHQNEKNVSNFSIEGGKIEKVGMDVTKSIARKVTITVTPCNKAAVASIVSVDQKPKKRDIDELFKTEESEIEVLVLKKDEGFGSVSGPTSPSLAASEPMAKATTKINAAPPNPLGSKIGMHGSVEIMSHAKPLHYGNRMGSKDFRAIATAHFNAGTAAGQAGNPKARQHHTNMTGWFMQAADRAEMREKAVAGATRPTGIAPSTGPKTKQVFHPDRSGKVKPPGPMAKALEAGSMMSAPADIVGGAALQMSEPKKKAKSKWLARAEEEYSKWNKREQFETFMSQRMPKLTKGEIRAIGQVMVLNKTLTLEKALSTLAGYEELSGKIAAGSDLEKAGGKNSIYTLILFDGCDLHDILHCSHFATDDISGDTFEKIKEVCDKYFESGVEAKELEFKEEGELGKEGQRVLFLTEGDPYKDLFEKLGEVAKYKYPAFKPHISVTSNVDSFKGKAHSLVISVNGEVKKKYDFKSNDKIPGGLADKKKPSDFDAKKLAEGIKVESEHTSDPSIAQEIAMDHLTEDPQYYEKLKIVEKNK